MKTRTEIVQEGELLGPVDWSYDFLSMFNGYCTTPEGKKEICDVALARLKTLQDEPGQWEATTYGGWPRCGWGAVLAVGMYDGWPFWKPTPSVLINGWLGSSWHHFASITNIRRKTDDGWEER